MSKMRGELLPFPVPYRTAVPLVWTLAFVAWWKMMKPEQLVGGLDLVFVMLERTESRGPYSIVLQVFSSTVGNCVWV